MKIQITTPLAPPAIGPYSQAIKVGNTCYLAGQIGLVPSTGTLIGGGIEAEVEQVFKNLSAVANACGGSLSDLVRISLYLTDLSHFALANEAMERYCPPPFPARSTIGVASLPRGALFEADAILYVG